MKVAHDVEPVKVGFLMDGIAPGGKESRSAAPCAGPSN
jgi:hypothetical protein